MLQFNGVSKQYGDQKVLDEVSFTVNKRERCGLVGRNGSGKTTLFRLIIGQESCDGGSLSTPKHYRLGYLDQHIRFTKESVLDEAATGLPLQERDDLYKAEAILFGLGFDEESLKAHPSSLSGGFHLRLHLAKVLLSDPDCLLLDEPTNYLDIVSNSWLRKFLQSWRKELILISHDREFMDSVTTHTLAIHRKRVQKHEGGTEEVFRQILLEEEVHEKTRQKLEQKKEHLESFIRRFGAKATKAKQAQSKAKAVEKMPTLEKLLLLDDLDFTFQYDNFPGKEMARIEGLSFSYEGADRSAGYMISNLSLEILSKERIAIIGKNGRGKSTILKLIAKEIEPLKGAMRTADRLKIGYFGQTNIDRLNPAHTVEEEISQANINLNIGQVRSICGSMLFSGDAAKKKIAVLSGGERSRVMLGKILASPCNLLLLDEPTHHLDMESIEALMTAIDLFPGSVVIVTHSEMILKELPLTKVVVCKKNHQQLVIGDYEDFMQRGGFESEEGSGSGKNREGVELTRQEVRLKNQEILQERGRAIAPLQKKMVAVERKIEELEMKLHKESDLLIEASEAEQGALIALYSKNISRYHREIEEFFSELEQLSQQLEEKKSYFDDRLNKPKSYSSGKMN